MICYTSSKKSFDELSNDVKDFSPDIFVSFASFEDRCLQTAKHVSSYVSNSIICYFDPIIEQVAENKHKLSKFFENSEFVKFSHDDPFEGIDNIFTCINAGDYKKQKILIDITTFSREALLSLMSAIDFNSSKFENVKFIYNPAKSYDIKKELSYGVKEIRSIIGFPGNVDPLKQTHLIMMVGYEDERAKKIIDAFEPSKVSFGFGSEQESSSVEIFENNKKIHKSLNDYFSPRYSVEKNFEFSLSNPCAVCDSLLQVADGNHNNVIVPMNNKISCLGAGLAGLKDRNFQIAYAQPETYNYANYSTPSDEYYLFSIDLKLDHHVSQKSVA